MKCGLYQLETTDYTDVFLQLLQSPTIASKKWVYEQYDTTIQVGTVVPPGSVVAAIVQGKRVVMVDDSIVRGTTSRRIVKLLKQVGAMEVHVRIASPPIKHPCYYGVDTSSADELLAAKKTVEQIKEEIAADSLSFISFSGLKKAVIKDKHVHGVCHACFTGEYVTKIAELH